VVHHAASYAICPKDPNMITLPRALATAVLAAALVVGSNTGPGANAQNTDTIKARKELFKGLASANKEPAAMAKGEVPFELSKVQAALKTFQTNAPKFEALFGDDAKTGGETEALPGIWDNKKDFNERFVKLAAAAKSAESTIKDEASFKAAWPALLGENCSSCHKVYRKPK
ncbi:MAG: cytochrome c, partial [Hyphomicrobiaceae bacterium]|nr:cytochrome c [Hyphomicrobiaceae bacterium]